MCSARTAGPARTLRALVAGTGLSASTGAAGIFATTTTTTNNYKRKHVHMVYGYSRQIHTHENYIHHTRRAIYNYVYLQIYAQLYGQPYVQLFVV